MSDNRVNMRQARLDQQYSQSVHNRHGWNRLTVHRFISQWVGADPRTRGLRADERVDTMHAAMTDPNRDPEIDKLLADLVTACTNAGIQTQLLSLTLATEARRTALRRRAVARGYTTL